jgi:hypothetical protein
MIEKIKNFVMLQVECLDIQYCEMMNIIQWTVVAGLNFFMTFSYLLQVIKVRKLPAPESC